MGTRVSVAAFLVTLGVGVVLGIFEIKEDWKMPDLVAVAIVLVAGGAALIGVAIVAHGMWVWSKPLRNRYSFQIGFHRRDLPDPNQWLLDLAKNQRNNPTSHLVITNRIIMGVRLTDKRPWLWVRVYFTNFGVNDLTISQPEGYPYFGNEQSDDYIRDEASTYTVPAGNSATSFDLKIYVPDAFLEEVRNEVESLSGEVRSISLGRVRARVWADAEGSPTVRWSIGGDREVFRPNQ